jgi:putative flippase GtrA
MNQLSRQVIRYYLASGITLLINFVIYYLLVSQAGINYLIAAIIGFVIEATLNYIINRNWAFRSTPITWGYGYIRSVVVAAITLGTILIVTSVGVEWFAINYLWSRIIAAIIAGTLSFILDKKFSFQM